MGAFQTLVTIVGLIGIVALLLLLFCRYLGGWTRSRAWVTSSREEKMVLTRGGVTGHYNPNGFMIPSDSDLNLSGGGSFRRFDKTDNDYQLLRQGSATSLSMTRQPNIPPQPLRPAPLPPPSQLTNQFQAQGSVDSVFTAPSSPCPPPKIPPPPNNQRNPGGAFPSLSATNPFLPLIQASTQFFSQTLQSLQSFQPNPQQQQQHQPPSGYFQQTNYYPSNDGDHQQFPSQMPPYTFQPQHSQQTRVSTHSNTSSTMSDSPGGVKGVVSMGELLFSTPPMYSPAPNTTATTHSQFNSGTQGPSSSSPAVSSFSTTTPSASTALEIDPLLLLPVVERQSLGLAMTGSNGNGSSGSSSGVTKVEPFSLNSNPVEETDTLINMEPCESPGLGLGGRGGGGREIQSEAEESRNSLLETMRAEIRLENQRMEDATKSLMEGELIGVQKKNPMSTGGTGFAGGGTEDQARRTSTTRAPGTTTTTTAGIVRDSTITGNGRTSSDSSSSAIYLDRPAGGGVMDRKFSAPEIGTPGGVPQHNVSSEIGTGTSTGTPSPSYRTRSFSLRQASIDSIGDMSDLSSPDSLPALQRAMSCDSVCSDTSVVLGDLDAPPSTGQLCIGLEYDSETADLIVNVMEGKELVGLDPDPSAPFDSYVRVYLLPDKTTNMQTRVYRKSLNPVYKEKFMFGLEMMELPQRSLVFYLYATTKFSNTLIGEAELKLTELDIKQARTTWLPLTDTGQKVGELGEIIFSLSYLPTAERLTVVVVKARNLKFPHQRDTGDPFVKVYLLQRGKKVSKKKSSTKRAEKNPIFNEAMIFSVPTHALQTIQLRISVSDSSETEGRAYSIGHVIVGSMSSGKLLSHWNQMLSSLRKPIAMWHSLRK